MGNKPPGGSNTRPGIRAWFGDRLWLPCSSLTLAKVHSQLPGPVWHQTSFGPCCSNIVSHQPHATIDILNTMRSCSVMGQQQKSVLRRSCSLMNSYTCLGSGSKSRCCRTWTVEKKRMNALAWGFTPNNKTCSNRMLLMIMMIDDDAGVDHDGPKCVGGWYRNPRNCG